MANHKSSLKRIRQEETRRLHNRYYGKTMRNAVRKLRATTDKAEAVAMLSLIHIFSSFVMEPISKPQHQIVGILKLAQLVSNVQEQVAWDISFES